MHPDKTKIVYCRDGRRRGAYPNVKFDFLGYEFRPREVRNSQSGKRFCGYTPAVSPSSLNVMREAIRDLDIRRQTQLTLVDIANLINPLLKGWIAYYGRYTPSVLSTILRHVNQTLVGWMMRKFKHFKAHKVRTGRFLQRLVRNYPSLFVHWQIGMDDTFA